MKRFMTMFLTFAVILCSFSIHTQAQGVTPIDNIETIASSNNNSVFLIGNFATYYFSRLTQNYGNNVKGSCGYVALGMLLSFYDTYFNDTIIPEQYDQPVSLTGRELNLQTMRRSPGIKQDNYNADIWGMPSDAEYVEIINNGADRFYHLYLLKRGLELGFYGDTPNNALIPENSENPTIPGSYGLGDDNFHTLLADCMQSYTDEYEIRHIQTGVLTETIRLISSGIPVAMNIEGVWKNENGEPKQDAEGNEVIMHHVVVAYDYDKSTGEIYVHAGWGQDKTHVALSSLLFLQSCSATALILNDDFEHEHSNNYQYRTSSGTVTHCPCELPMHPEYNAQIPSLPEQPPVHVHDEYWDVCEDWHSYNCETCGLSGIEDPHDFTPYRPSETPRHDHLLRCHCGYLSYGYCTYNIAIPYTQTQHVSYCLCGAYDIYSHVFVAAPATSNYNWSCRYCGYGSHSVDMPTPQSLVSGDVMMQMNSSGVITLPDGTTLRILTETGSYVLSNGIIVLSPEDAALVEAGLLDPYELVENITVPAGPGHVTE